MVTTTLFARMLAVRSSRPLALCAAAPLQKSLVVHKDSEGGSKHALEKFYPLKREAVRFNQHENKVEYLTTKLDDVVNYIRTGSLWPMTFGYETVHVEIFLNFLKQNSF